MINRCNRPAHQPNRVFADEPPDIRVVVPERIVIKPRLRIRILTLHSDGLLRGMLGPAVVVGQLFREGGVLGHFFERQSAPRPVSGPPEGLTGLIGEFFGRAVDVRVKVINLCPRARGFEAGIGVVDPGNGLVAAGLVDVSGVVAVSLLLQQTHAVPDETHLGEGVAPGDSPAQGVVFVAAVLAHAPLFGGGFNELVLLVPPEPQRGVVARALFDETAVFVVLVTFVLKDQ